MAKLKSGGESASRRNYRAELVAERLTGEYSTSFCTPDMQRGIELEAEARAVYEFVTDRNVESVGFILHPTIDMAGASPDGFVGEDGLIEIKVPRTATHIDYLLGGKAPAEYLNQMQWQMECTGRQWCDFVSYDPRMPVELQLFTVRIERDEKRIEEIRGEVIALLAEVDDTVSQLMAKMEAA